MRLNRHHPNPTAASRRRMDAWEQGWCVCAGLSGLGPCSLNSQPAWEANQGQVPDSFLPFAHFTLAPLLPPPATPFPPSLCQWHVLQRGTWKQRGVVCWWLKTSLLVVHRGKDPAVVYISTYHYLWLCKIGDEYLKPGSEVSYTWMSPLSGERKQGRAVPDKARMASHFRLWKS